MIKYIAVFSLMLIAYSNVLAGGKNNFNLVGEWFGEAPNGDKITYVFKKGGNVDWITDTKASQGGTVKAKYKTDSSKNPITIDIFDFDLKRIRQFKFLGIISVKNKDTILLHGNPGPKTSSSHRPKVFSSKTIEFKRKTTSRKGKLALTASQLKNKDTILTRANPRSKTSTSKALEFRRKTSSKKAKLTLTASQLKYTSSLSRGVSAQAVLKKLGVPFVWGETGRDPKTTHFNFALGLTLNGLDPLDFVKTASRRVTWLYLKPGHKDPFVKGSSVLLFFTNNKLDKLVTGAVADIDCR